MAIIPSYSAFRRRFYTGASPPTRDLDGYATWPLAEIGSGGFTGLEMPTNPATIAFPFNVQVNGGAMDTSAWTDEYDWFLSQRTDVEANQYLVATQWLGTGVPIVHLSFSAVMAIDLTALGAATFPLLTPDELFRLFYNVHIYVQRKSDDAILVGDLGASLFAG